MTGSSALKRRSESSCPDWHSAHMEHPVGLWVPTEPWWKSWHEGSCFGEVLWLSFHRGTAAGWDFLPQQYCRPARLDSCVVSGNEQLNVSCHFHVTHLGLAQALCSLPPPRSIVAGSSMLLSCICLFSLPEIFVQRQNLISKPLCVPVVCSQLEFKTSVVRVGITA